MIEYDRYQAGSPCQEWWVLMKRNGGYSWSGIYRFGNRLADGITIGYKSTSAIVPA